ncbi:hypothetical protein HMPREF0578_1604 [Mobiluncus mulieris 28-1]|nr:hypothetical protein HMPREF0578_1604 [Mobiluncus mulieris 28-1]
MRFIKWFHEVPSGVRWVAARPNSFGVLEILQFQRLESGRLKSLSFNWTNFLTCRKLES